MINAPQAVLDALDSGNYIAVNLISVNLGDAYDVGSDTILRLTDCGHDVDFGGQTYTSDNNLSEIAGISRKASAGSDSVDIEFALTDPVLINAIKAERYINKPTSINRVLLDDSGDVISNFSIPVRTAWGISHSFSPEISDGKVTLTIDSSLGDLTTSNGWFVLNSSHERRYPGDKIMTHGGTVMTDEQKKRYTTNFKGSINEDVKPPALSKIYGYKNVELVPICMLKHRKSHSSYRHYFTTLIYAVNIGDCDNVDLSNLRKDDEVFEYSVVNDTSTDVGGWSVRLRTPSETVISIQTDTKLNFWRENMDISEKARLLNMYGRGLTLLFVKNRNRDDWLQSAPRLTIPVRGSSVYDPRTSSNAYSRNPALQYADFLRSNEYGAGNRGINVTDANLTALANHFDNLPGSSGNPGINNILIDVQVDTGEALIDNMNIWMKGCRLFTSDYYGEYNVRAETISPTVWSLTSDDLVDVAESTSGEFTSRLNQLTYSIKQLVPDPNEVGKLVEVDVEATFPPDGSQTLTDWLEADGGVNLFESSQLDYVTVLQQAYFWTMVDARISRQPREIELPVGARGWLSEPSDVIEYSDEITGDNNVLWRVQDVDETEDGVILTCVAYADEFYSPDPSVIPDPTPAALLPVDSMVINNISVEEIRGQYIANWDLVSNAEFYAYSLFLTSDLTTPIVEDRIINPPVTLPELPVEDYTLVVNGINAGNEGTQASFEFSVGLPEEPTLDIAYGNFSAHIIPVISGSTLVMEFELLLGTTAVIGDAVSQGKGSTFTLSELSPNTTYYIWVKSINIVGESAWVNAQFTTTNDNTELANFIGVSPSDKYFIRYPDGTAIKNGQGSLDVQAVERTSSGDVVLTSGDVKLYDGNTDLGYTASFDANDINGHVNISLENRALDPDKLYDTVTLVDVADGEDAIVGTMSIVSGRLSWVQDKNNGSWSPSATTADLLFTFYKKGVAIATRTVRITRSNVTLSAASTGNSGESTSLASTGSGTNSISVTVTHTSSGVKVSESVVTVQGGDQGSQGVQGVPGTPGTDGTTLYTWIKYSANANGNPIQHNPTSTTKYIGFAYNKTSPSESSNYWDYTWSDIKGTDGVPGTDGTDGNPNYTWIKYSDNSNGSGMYDIPNGNTAYIGIAINKLTPTESTNAADYTWSRFKGDPGATGGDGPIGIPGDPGSDALVLTASGQYKQLIRGGEVTICQVTASKTATFKCVFNGATSGAKIFGSTNPTVRIRAYRGGTLLSQSGSITGDPFSGQWSYETTLSVSSGQTFYLKAYASWPTSTDVEGDASGNLTLVEQL